MPEQSEGGVDRVNLGVGTASIVLIAITYVFAIPHPDGVLGIVQFLAFTIAYWFLVKPVTDGWSKVIRA